MELLIKAAVLGVVEGITEFLPISSTGHLIIVNRFINFTGPFADMFDVVIQLGAILSVLVYFRNRLYPFVASKNIAEKHEIFGNWKKAVVGVLPALVIGAAFGSTVEAKLFNPVTVALALFVGGLLLMAAERRRNVGTIQSVSDLGYRTAIAIGFIQCLAMVPGTSRAAATIIGAMLLGASRPVAVEFSFFLSIPTMVAASGYSLLKHGATLSGSEWLALAVGFAVSFVVALGVIAFLMNYIRKHDFKVFAWYRIALALVIGLLLYSGVLSGV
ncbi:MAG: undecaprenyl-diphosphate phosphatase [Fibrobacterota bacterium]